MVWFQCDCGETLKKPKVAAHLQRCSASQLTCVDCSQTFGRHNVQSHSQCVTEHDKYAKGVTKVQGYTGGQPSASAGRGPAQPVGLEFLSSKPPYECRLCKVQCTSKDTLHSHAAGAKHARRVKAATAAASPAQPASAEPSQPAVSPMAPQAAGPGTPEQTMAATPSTPAEPGGDLAPAQSTSRPPKWKKRAREQLQAKSGRMKLAKLTHTLLTQHPAATPETEASLLRILQGSSQFQIQGQHITLASK